MLGSMIASVSNSAMSMERLGQALAGDASEISGEVSSIGKDISELNFSVEEQSASVTETSATITQIARNIESLTAQIESQSTAVTQSSAASGKGSISAVQDRSISIAKAAETINGAVEKIVQTSASNSNAIDALVDMTGKFRL